MKKMFPFIFFLMLPLSITKATYNIYMSDDDNLGDNRYLVEFYVGYEDTNQDSHTVMTYDSELYKTTPILQLASTPERIFVVLRQKNKGSELKYECCITNNYKNADWFITTYHVLVDGNKTKFARQNESVRSAIRPTRLFLKILTQKNSLQSILSVSHGNLIRFE